MLFVLFVLFSKLLFKKSEFCARWSYVFLKDSVPDAAAAGGPALRERVSSLAVAIFERTVCEGKSAMD